jgi:hypothetical protein
VEVGGGSAFCPNCGAPIGPGYNGPAYGVPVYSATPQKSTGIAIVLAFLVPGLGHLYAGKITRGILIMSFGIAVSIISLVIFFGMGTLSYDNYVYADDWIFGYLLFLIVVGIVDFVIWVWNIYDVNKVVNEYNAHVRSTGNPPW